MTICRLPDRTREDFFGAGGVWPDDDRIFFTVGSLELTRVSAGGGDLLEVLSFAPEETAFHHLSGLQPPMKFMKACLAVLTKERGLQIASASA
jgi:hypothetical protein